MYNISSKQISKVLNKTSNISICNTLFELRYIMYGNKQNNLASGYIVSSDQVASSIGSRPACWCTKCKKQCLIQQQQYNIDYVYYNTAQIS